MRWSRKLSWSLAAWLAIGLFWFVVTRKAHPTLALALVTTCSLVIAYALVIYLNFLVFVPKYFRSKRYARHFVSLLGAMAFLTALALGVIRVSYYQAVGPDPDPNGFWVHFMIDFAGMTVHLLAATALVWILSRKGRRKAEPAVIQA